MVFLLVKSQNAIIIYIIFQVYQIINDDVIVQDDEISWTPVALGDLEGSYKLTYCAAQNLSAQFTLCWLSLRFVSMTAPIRQHIEIWFDTFHEYVKI